MRGIIVLLAVSFMLLSGCSSGEAGDSSLLDDIKRSMDKAKVKADEIVHVEVVKDGFQVFYRDGEGLNTGFAKNDAAAKWTMLSQETNNLKPEAGLSWSAINKEGLHMHFFYGVLANPDIARVITKKPDGSLEKSAKIITTDTGIRLWFTYYDKQVDAPMDIVGLDNGGHQIYP
ncbi:hypothetical protein EV294_109163 [Paenibacillus sp. BK033]|uniref:hypothetical protein n=1 Tax=Paenibacillus sp. BK033 TaxID=2512133 RepID=UPI0010520552|nr:hypothetical protein [Paenibacillus sp. BK033]TCM91086.1 hypothetical protein EV294_109163 [Paenibacillus sp. BK033]